MAETSPDSSPAEGQDTEKNVTNKFVVEASKTADASKPNPFGGKGLSGNKWTAARGRLKTSVVLNISARKNVLAKADMLVDDGHGHHHHHWCGKYMIHPNNKIRKYWDVGTVIFVLYLCFKIPFSMGFEHWYGNKSLKPFEIFMDWWFGIDIILNFCTGFIHDGHLVMNPWATMNHYFEFWFWIDILATIPFEMFVEGMSKKDRKAIKMVKWLKITRLLRIGRILKLLKGYARFYKVFLALIGFIWMMHFMGCMWISIVEPCIMMDANGYPWYAHDRIDPVEVAYIQYKGYTMYAEGSDCNDVWRMYATALDYGAKAMLGASPLLISGEDDWIHRVTSNQAGSMHAFGFFTSAFGIICTAWVFGETFVILSHVDPQGWDYFGRLDRIKKELVLYNLPEDIQHDVLQYYDYLYMNSKHGKQAILGDVDMSVSLKKRVAIALHVDTIRKIDLFKNASTPCIQKACQFLVMEIHMPHEIIISAGEQSLHVDAIKMYVVERGKLSVIKGLPSKHATKGHHGHGHGHGHGDHEEKSGVHGYIAKFKKFGKSSLKKKQKTAEEIEEDKKFKEAQLSEQFGHDEEVIVTEIGPGLSFGEINIIDPFHARNNSIRTKTICELYTLTHHDFRILLEAFPTFGNEVKKVADRKHLSFTLDHYHEAREMELHEGNHVDDVPVNEKLKYIDRQLKTVMEGIRRLEKATS